MASFSAYCPKCKQHLSISDELNGAQVQCPSCQSTFTALPQTITDTPCAKSQTIFKIPPISIVSMAVAAISVVTGVVYVLNNCVKLTSKGLEFESPWMLLSLIGWVQTGVVLLALAEVIRLLTELNNKNK